MDSGELKLCNGAPFVPANRDFGWSSDGTHAVPLQECRSDLAVWQIHRRIGITGAGPCARSRTSSVE
jgi:hypothetical protein